MTVYIRDRAYGGILALGKLGLGHLFYPGSTSWSSVLISPGTLGMPRPSPSPFAPHFHAHSQRWHR
jgi:hypothetical protein